MGSPRFCYYVKRKQNQELLQNGQSKSVFPYTERITLLLGEATHKIKI